MADFKLRREALGEIAKSREVGADLDRRAARIAAAAGPGYRAVGGLETRRERATVVTATVEARIDQAKNNTLVSAFDAGRS